MKLLTLLPEGKNLFKICKHKVNFKHAFLNSLHSSLVTELSAPFLFKLYKRDFIYKYFVWKNKSWRLKNKEVYRPVSSQLNCKNHSIIYLVLEIRVSTTCFSLYPCSFLVSSALLANLKSTSQIPNLYNDLHMQQSRICYIKYVINKKVLEKYYWVHNYYAGCFLFTIGIVCFFHFRRVSTSSFMTQNDIFFY